MYISYSAQCSDHIAGCWGGGVGGLPRSLSAYFGHDTEKHTERTKLEIQEDFSKRKKKWSFIHFMNDSDNGHVNEHTHTYTQQASSPDSAETAGNVLSMKLSVKRK